MLAPKNLVGILALTTTVMMLGGCMTQPPAQIVDKSQTYFGKEQVPQPKTYNQASDDQIDSDSVVVQSLAPLATPPQQQQPSVTTTTTTTNTPSSGYLISKTKVVREVPAEQPKQVAAVEPKKPAKDEFINDNPANSSQDVPSKDDLTYEEPIKPSKQESAAGEIPDAVPGFRSKTPLSMAQFDWPLASGKVMSRFGKHGNKFNEGMNISAPLGSPVSAAGDGKVIYIGNNIEGYGNLLIIKHSGDYMTAYSHLQDILVERGVQVKKGETVGAIGQTGNVTSPQLHFSIRKGKKTIDPEGKPAA